MDLTLAYRGRSAIAAGQRGLTVALAPNLRRDRVAFDGRLSHPLRFREAIGALHDVVVSDLRYRPKDNSAYQAYLAERRQGEMELRRSAESRARAAVLKEAAGYSPAEAAALEKNYRKMRSLYWGARQKYADYLFFHDLELWRLLVP